MKGNLYLILSLTVSLLQVAIGWGQGCETYETEMKSYFKNYSPNSSKYIQVMEEYWEKCPKPTAEMNLIYYYTKANYYLNAYQNKRSRRSAYEMARDNYYLAAQEFDLLRVKRYSGDDFWETLSERIKTVEDQLASSDPYSRYRGEKFTRRLEERSQQGSWAKTHWVINVSKGTSRAAEEPSRPSFEKKYYYRGKYVDKIPESREAGESTDEKEDFGYVGQVDTLSLMEYLEWMENQSSKRPEEVYFDATAWIKALGPGYEASINVMDSLVMKDIPGTRGNTILKVAFGEAVARIESQESVYKDDITFIKVKVESGEEGWIPQVATIPDGALAVITESVIASVRPGSRLDRGRFILSPGDLVVLSDEEEEYIQVVTRNFQSTGWINTNSGWSILYDDIVIGLMYQEAMKLPYLVDRRKELETITNYPGFYDSSLSKVVLSEIDSLR